MKKMVISLLMMINMFSGYIYAEENSSWGIGGHPIIGYESNYGCTIGASAVIYFKPDNPNQDLDEIELTSTVNQAGQYDFMTQYSKYFKDNMWAIDGEFGYQNYPDDFMGEDYDAVYLPLSIGISRKVSEHVYIGPAYDFQYSSVQVANPDSAPLAEAATKLGGS